MEANLSAHQLGQVHQAWQRFVQGSQAAQQRRAQSTAVLHQAAAQQCISWQKQSTKPSGGCTAERAEVRACVLSMGASHFNGRPCWFCRCCTLATAQPAAQPCLQLGSACSSALLPLHRLAQYTLHTVAWPAEALHATPQLLPATPYHRLLQAFCSMAESTGGLAVEPVDLATRLLDLQVGASFVFLTLTE